MAVTIPQKEYNRLLAESREYRNLCCSLLEGGLDPATLYSLASDDRWLVARGLATVPSSPSNAQLVHVEVSKPWNARNAEFAVQDARSNSMHGKLEKVGNNTTDGARPVYKGIEWYPAKSAKPLSVDMSKPKAAQPAQQRLPTYHVPATSGSVDLNCS